MKNKAIPLPMNPEIRWGVFNYGLLQGVYFLRKDALHFIKNETVPRWCFTIEKVLVQKVLR